MASKELRTNVVVSGKVKKQGFNDIKGSLEEALQLAQQVSQAIIDFGKDSSEVYGNYEQNMADARAAMVTGSDMSAREVLETFDQLDEAAREWASTSKFTTADVSNAISEAAHAGWDLNKIMEVMPNAMLIAQAGGLDLSEALNYMIKSSNALGDEFEGFGPMIDQWTRASSSSATNIGEMGEAMLTMGSSMQFADGNAELMTMVGLLANAGKTGKEAGTVLRNTMLRIAAPTNKARQIMEGLGLSLEDLEEDGGVLNAGQVLDELGVSAYDAEGNLRSMHDIFADLYIMTKDMDAESRNGALAKIFGQKNISAAMALMQAAGDAEGGWDSLYNKVYNSTGAAQTYSDIVMDTQNSKLALLNAAYEELQRTVGEKLSPLVTSVAETLTGMINSLTAMDPAGFEAIVTALGTFAGLSTTLGAAVAVVKTMGTLGVWGGLALFGLAAASATAGIVALNQALEEQRFEENFGEMNLDFEPVKQYLQGMSTEYEAAAGKISEFNEAVAGAEEAYKTASANLSRDMYSILMTGGTVDPQSLETMVSYGQQMYNALITGVENAEASSITFWQYIFGGKENASKDENYRTLLGAISTGYQEAIDKAGALDKQLREQLTEAWKDGQLTETERQRILDTMNDYNALMAEIENAQAAGQREKVFRKAQTASWDSVKELTEEITAARDAQLAVLDENFWNQYGQAKYWLTNDDDGFTDVDQALLDNVESQYKMTRGERADLYNDVITTMFESMLNDSDFADTYNKVKHDVNYTGNGIDDVLVYATYYKPLEGMGDLHRSLEQIVEAFGGSSGFMQMMKYYESIGDSNQLAWMYDMAKMYYMSGSNNAGFIWDELAKYAQYSKDWSNVFMGIAYDQTALAQQKLKVQEYADSNPIAFPVNFKFPGGVTGGNGYNYIKGFAEGGRADSASIFGEAGAEWAIPEEHSLNTANLINQARAASGFSWSELMSSVGATASSGNQTFVYSPTIHAENADGVAQTLEADKKRMQKWWREMQMTERTVSYA